jgi:Caspase domain
MTRKALIIGIDHYAGVNKLDGCVHDAKKMEEFLEKHEDGSPNFSIKRFTSSSNINDPVISQVFLRQQINHLFEGRSDCLLFYFSGHGYESSLGGCLVAQNFTLHNEGILFSELLTCANKALETKAAKEIVLILDCCHSGHMGNSPFSGMNNLQIAEGLSILTASLPDELAVGEKRGGVFTQTIREALRGGNSDILGNVTIADVYRYADLILTAWQQRPMFKAHIHRMTVLRECKPKIELEILRMLTSYFLVASAEFKLDSSYEPTEGPEHPEHELIFSHLQAMRAIGLVEPIGEKHLYDAAMNNKSCRLTPMGKFYWSLVEAGEI